MLSPDLPAISNLRAGLGMWSWIVTAAPAPAASSAAISPAGPAPITATLGFGPICSILSGMSDEDAPDHPLCALCERPILPCTPQSLHHLVPKLRGGKGGPVVLVHQICHNEIHASASEAELARLWNTPESLRTHPRLA